MHWMATTTITTTNTITTTTTINTTSIWFKFLLLYYTVVVSCIVRDAKNRFLLRRLYIEDLFGFEFVLCLLWPDSNECILNTIMVFQIT